MLNAVGRSRVQMVLGHLATGKLSLSTQKQVGTCFESGMEKAANGEEWAPNVAP